MMLKRYGKRIIVWFAIFVLTICVPCCAFASADVTPSPAPTAKPVPEGVFIIYPQYSQNMDLLLLKSKLYNSGYYIAQVSEDDLRSPMLDDFTMLAIKECCRINNLEYSEYGILHSTWNAIVNDGIVNANATPSPTPIVLEDAYPHIHWNDTSEAVIRLQEKLQSLGYGINMRRGIYDQAMLETIEEFCTLNNIAYDQRAENGIAPWLQEMIITGDSVAFFVTPSPAPSAEVTVAPAGVEKARLYFTGTTKVFNFELPTIALWIISLGLIVGCIFIIIHFFVPGDPNARRSGSNKETRRTNASRSAKVIHFEIEYKGEINHYSCSLTRHGLEIGRQVGSFPLNMDDLSISRKHCVIYYSDKLLMMRDCSGYSWINNKPSFNGEYLLNNGDVLRIGHHNITITF